MVSSLKKTIQYKNVIREWGEDLPDVSIINRLAELFQVARPLKPEGVPRLVDTQCRQANLHVHIQRFFEVLMKKCRTNGW